MITVVSILIDTNRGTALIQEDGAEQVEYGISTASVEAIAEDVGDAVQDYLTGLM